MINLTNLIALFRHHRKKVGGSCPPTCFCYRVEEIIKEETEPRPKPKVVELVTQREQIVDKLCKHAESLEWGPAQSKPDSYDVDPEDRIQESIPPDITAVQTVATPAFTRDSVFKDGNVFYLSGKVDNNEKTT